ncbi:MULTISPECIES: 30S ribosomal protein S1 [Aminobacterium]|jgi:small subunit ribosomal protein S1|uniref:RNA binding S1 domain protein n=1 Tax=Aminobacterium colombiense (strain DSM 12261 / ALA-1) TaxID=572547 RepID=D5EF15_AMICL|nr:MULTISPECIES: S1 RNA-binding domain-containing protein [Aminobacterium]MDD2378348.1 S1 RNA-binding domain-containing protein [Aminobacterium colombiense]ADE57147.1 RNA binding S1 domain protein [Aminobacterium colombiense DSM 12261]MDD4264811.1 S1 RNA-binding domain-containing protein [Aminobacterium colombiense]MDD4585066.1 S1 RNA-binding domain-containing protein [Aminobacterium colombiense]NLK29788.1 S1 RNA-binding domain-containing protein [Aminobacterium colombiense]
MMEEMNNDVKTTENFENMDMESMLEKYAGEEIHKGKVVTGTIVGANEDGWLVDVGYKCEGFLPRREWTHKILVEEEEEPSINDEIQVQVINIRHGEDAQLLVSRWRCEFDRRWAELESFVSSHDLISVRGIRKVKGGLMVNCFNLEGFIPISHLAEEGRGVNPGKFVGEVFDVKLLEKDRRKRRLVLSRRMLVEEAVEEQRNKFYTTVSEGDILEGRVSSITSFGAFINLGPIDGLVHISELSWKRNVKPKEVVKKGETVKVKVIGIEQENNRVSLSIKQTQPDPWSIVEENWKIGDKASGVVTNVTDFGAFVEVGPGIEGLIHIGDLSWARIKHPRDVLKKGQNVEVVVLDVDAEKKRMSLGYKQLNDPWTGIEERYTKGQDITVKVVRLADFGAFVEVEEGVEGLIHISQLSTKRVDKPEDVLSEGEEVLARVIEINPAERRMRLSISALFEEEIRKNREEEKKKRLAQKAEESRQKQQPTFHEEEPSITIGDVLKDFLNR